MNTAFTLLCAAIITCTCMSWPWPLNSSWTRIFGRVLMFGSWMSRAYGKFCLFKAVEGINIEWITILGCFSKNYCPSKSKSKHMKQATQHRLLFRKVLFQSWIFSVVTNVSGILNEVFLPIQENPGDLVPFWLSILFPKIKNKLPQFCLGARLVHFCTIFLYLKISFRNINSSFC